MNKDIKRCYSQNNNINVSKIQVVYELLSILIHVHMYELGVFNKCMILNFMDKFN